MAAPSNIVGIARQQTVFACLESSKGTLVFPTESVTIPLVLAGYIDVNQNPSFTDSDDVRDTRDLLSQFQDMTPAGTFSMPMYARPSGTAGTAPMGDAIFQSLLGKKTVNASTSVVYSPAITKPSLSIWAKKGHTMFFSAGAVAETLRLTATNKGGVKFDIGGSFLQMGWAGRDALAAIAALNATSLTVYDATKYTVGARIYNATKSDSNTSTGYTVTAVNTTTNVLTVSPGISQAWAIDDIIQPFLPTGAAVPGAPLESRKTGITIGGTSKVLQSLDLSYDDKVKMLDDEISTNGYPSDYVENNRKTSGTAKAYFKQNDLAQWVAGYAGNESAIVTTFGTVAGSKLQVSMPRTKIQVPKVTTSAPTLQVSMDFTALGTSGEDSISMTWL